MHRGKQLFLRRARRRQLLDKRVLVTGTGTGGSIGSELCSPTRRREWRRYFIS